MDLAQENHGDGKSIKCLIGIRLLLASFILGVGVAVLRVERFPFYVLLASFYISTLFFMALLKSKMAHLHQIALQLGWDITLILGLLHYSGGVDSVFISLTLLPLIAAGTLLPWFYSMLLSLFTSVSYLALVFMEQSSLWPVSAFLNVPYRGVAEVFYLTFMRLIIFWVVAFLSAALAKKLKIEQGAFTRLKNLNDIILDQIGSGIVTVDNQNKIVFVNQGAQKLIGASLSELLGQDWKKLFYFTNESVGKENWDESSHVVRGFEVALRCFGGNKIPIGFNVSPLKDSNDQVCGKVMVFRDLTRIKELERKKQQAERLAAIGETASSIAHEIRNPLSSISGSVEVLMHKNAIDPKFSNLMEIVLREVKRMNGIIERFLHFTRHGEIEREWLDVEPVLEEVILLLRNDGKWGERIQIRKTNLIGGKTKTWFAPDQMKQVFYNLLLNACEAMPQGGHIEIRLSEDLSAGEAIRIDICDQGTGISEEEMRKIFTPFHTTKKTGSGLGLSVVHQIMQDHGGSVEAQSQAGRGTTFTLLIPRREELQGAA